MIPEIQKRKYAAMDKLKKEIILRIEEQAWSVNAVAGKLDLHPSGVEVLFKDRSWDADKIFEVMARFDLELTLSPHKEKV